MSGVLPKWFTSPHAPQSPAPQSHFERRSAIRSDIDDIFEVVQAGFPDDPEVNYRFPNRSQYPDQYADWTKTEYIGYLNQPKKFEIQVIEALDRYGSRSVVALAVWDKAVLTPAADIDQGLDSREDANKKHCEKYNEVVAECFQKYFAKYAESQIHLWLIVTHPKFRRRGAGTMLMEWGLETAKKKEWPVTVFASPMGRLLYAHLGFQDVATEYIQVEDEEDKLTFTVMEFDAKHQSHTGFFRLFWFYRWWL